MSYNQLTLYNMKTELALAKKRLKVLNETIKAYNINTRCVDTQGDGNCKYYLKGHQGCAVGRLIDDVKLKKRLNDGDEEGDSSVLNLFDILPKKVQKLGMGFLVDLQGLHDKRSYWDEKGLTKEGKQEVKKIKDVFKLNTLTKTK